MVDTMPAGLVDKGCATQPHCSQNITPAERDVLTLLTKEFLTQAQIARRRKCTRQAVSKLIQSLKQKGFLGTGLTSMVDTICTQPDGSNLEQVKFPIRLHGEEWNLQIINISEEYRKARNKTNFLHIDGNTVRLHPASLEIYSGHSFLAKDALTCDDQSRHYWMRFFTRLEQEFQVILLKPRYQNIKRVKAHYAEVGNELAKFCNTKKEKIKIFSSEDGKEWFIIDNSFNLHEAETTHPHTSSQDMQQVVQPFFNDLRQNNPPLLSELYHLVSQSIALNRETAAGVNILVKMSRPAMPPPEENQNVRPWYVG